MAYFLLFEPLSSPEVAVTCSILWMRKLRPGDVSSHGQGSSGATWPVRFLPRAPILLLLGTLLVLPQREPLHLLHSWLGLRGGSFLPELKHALPKGAPEAVGATDNSSEGATLVGGDFFFHPVELVK